MPDARLDEARLRRLLEVGRTLVAELDLEPLLHQFLEVARELTGARYAALGVLDERREELERFITSGIDEQARERIGSLPRGRGVLGVLIKEPQPLRLARVSEHPRSYGFPPNHPPMTTFLGVPIRIRGVPWGNLYLTEKDGGEFTEADEESVVVLSEWVSIAIENARSVAQERLELSMAAAEHERRRWARELHDETLQALGGLRVLLASSLSQGDEASLRTVVEQAVEHTEIEIRNLRNLITELRPAALDELGLGPAIESLAERTRAVEGIDVELRLELGVRLDPELENTVYRVLQEALTNVGKHARATRAEVFLAVTGGHLAMTVRDDGSGFDPTAASSGFGLQGMRERVLLARGALEIDSRAGSGTKVRARFPLRPR